MESLPDEIIEAILGSLPDVLSIVNFAMTSRKCRDAAARADPDPPFGHASERRRPRDAP